jgi:Family of unknown function (DUF5709)
VSDPEEDAMSELPPDQGEATGADPSVDISGDTQDREAYHGYSVDDETQPQSTGDSQTADDRGLEEPLEEGWSPPEKWSAAMGYGNTPLEEQLGETLDQRVAQEVPEPDPYAEAESDESDEVEDDTVPEVGDARAGRLVEPDEGWREDREGELEADDVGIDGAGASAEEAAVHVVDEDAYDDAGPGTIGGPPTT